MKQCLNIGIDHGTYASCLAIMESTGPRVIKINGVDEIMPSVVYMDQRGRTLIGTPAYQAMFYHKPNEGDGYTGYKLRIGQGDRYEFTAAKKSLTAPELGGLVIGALLKACQEDSGETPQAAVITVPAKFEHNACDGTREAARLAGLRCYPLLQEPVAAAMAYGFTATDRKAQWMVFDLGGGTLDVSLVFVRDGQMVVPEEGHAGDNRLGGRKFDREILDYALTELKKQYALDGFSENNRDYRQAWGRLLIACEVAKIELSNREQSTIEVTDTLCKDGKGKDVKVFIPITRGQYQKMISADVEKCVHICKTLLTQNRLAVNDLTKLILIGGPTRTPYVVSALQDGLGTKIDTAIDPMTAVSIGAAIHAASVELPEELRPTLRGADLKTGVNVTLKYERAPKIPALAVVGKVESVKAPLDSLQIEIRRDGWSTGRLPIGEDGLFETELKLIDQGKPACSKFTMEVLEKSGKVLFSVAEPEVWFPLPEGHARLANSLLVAVKGNKTETLVKKGAALPTSAKQHFKTVKQVRRGGSEDVLKINILEGVSDLFGHENEAADLNVHVGQLQIPGGQIEQDLPAGADIEIVLEVDASREVLCRAYVSLLDQEFEAPIKSEPFGVSLSQLEEKFASVKESLKSMEKLQAEFPLSALTEKFEAIQRLNVIEEIAKEIDRAKLGDKDAFNRAYRRTLELEGALSRAAQEQSGPRIRQQILQLKGVADASEQRSLREMEAEFEGALKSNDRGVSDRIEGSLAEMDAKVRRRPYFDLLLDLASTSDLRVNSKQSEVFKKAAALMERLDAKGGVEKLTDTDLADLRAAHREFVDSYPELGELWQKLLDGLPPGRDMEDLGRDLEKARH